VKRRRAARVMGLLVAEALTGVLILGCRKSTETSEQKAKNAALVAEPRHDFGHVAQGATLRQGFTTHNATAAPLTIDDASEVLGCSGVPIPRVLEPQRDGKFEVTCRASVYGSLRVSLPLRASGRPAGELSLVAEVEPLLVFDRAVLELNAPFGDESHAETRLRGALARRAHLTLAGQAPAGTEVSVLSAVDGAEGASLRLFGAPVGTHAGSIRFSTGLEQPKELALSYLVKVKGTLTVSPTNPVLHLGAPGGTRSVLTVRSTQAGFAVKRAEVLEGPFAARVRRAGGDFEVDVSVVPGKVSPKARGANGRVLIVSNDRAEPRKEVPLIAIGRADLNE
jgi:hypothetical protein